MKITLSIISLFFLFSCSDNQKVNWCKEGIIQAEKEIEKEGLVFVKYLTIAGGANRYDEELKELFKKSEIKFRYESISDIEIKGEYEKRKCFNETLIKEIENKFGKRFIVETIEKADSQFANRENFIFDYSVLDEQPFFPNKKGKKFSGEEFVKFINKYLKYPPNYQLAKTVEERPFVEIEFVIDKEGNPSNFKIGNSVFPKKKEVFKEYFEREISKIILKIPEWEAGKIRTKKVDTKFVKRIPLDWII